MNPQDHENQPSFELPPAQQVERRPDIAPESQPADMTEKQTSVAVEHGISQTASAPPTPPQMIQQVPQSQTPQASSYQGQGTSLTDSPQTAEDVDLIEKEWVSKAKEIVARTRNDPHLQNKEIIKFKADYLKKRYNKELKMSEE